MISKLFWRLLIGVCFAVPLGLAGVAIGHASPQQQTNPEGECQDCHVIIQDHWANGAHSKATTDPVFVEQWEAAGNDPACLTCHTTGYDSKTGLWEVDGVSCTTCHVPSSSNHPDQIMPTDVSSRLCGQCHLDTFSEWQSSTHGQEELTCVKCHDSHSAGLKADSVQDLCQACHNEEVHFFSFTAHAAQGLLCTDCHLRVSDSQMGEGHGQRIHTFKVDMETCSRCHTKEMHFPISDAMTSMPLQAGVMNPIDGTEVNEVPQPANPYGFAIVAGLVGMAFGMLVAPWMERWYRRLTSISD